MAVLGASGGIGQPLSLLLKINPHIKTLALYDLIHTPGVAADLSHCATQANVTGHQGEEELAAALKDSHIVAIPAGVPRKPGECSSISFFSSIYATFTSIFGSPHKNKSVHC